MQIIILIFETAPRIPVVGWLLGLVLLLWPFQILRVFPKKGLVWNASLLAMFVPLALVATHVILFLAAMLGADPAWNKEVFRLDAVTWIQMQREDGEPLWTVLVPQAFYLDVVLSLAKMLISPFAVLNAVVAVVVTWALKLALLDQALISPAPRSSEIG